MKPALTQYEWGTLEVCRQHNGWRDLRLSWTGLYLRRGLSGSIPASLFHATAALCLHDQQFGFTREDVAALRDASSSLAHKKFDSGITPYLDAVADRIEALLPPEAK